VKSVMSYYKILEKDQTVKPMVVKLIDGERILIDEAYCSNPTCPCTDVLLRFYKIDEDNQDMNKLFSFSLDVRTWKISDKKIYNKEIKAKQIIDEFVDYHLDDELKNRFGLHWAQSKEYGQNHYLDYLSKSTIDELES